MASAAPTIPRNEGGSGDRSGCRLSTRLKTAGTVSSPNAGLPVAAKVIVTAQLKTSDGGPTGDPDSCSGDM
ncbi:hypothetical protein GCM10020219_072100 [Nonomuraea dietziae]